MKMPIVSLLACLTTAISATSQPVSPPNASAALLVPDATAPELHAHSRTWARVTAITNSIGAVHWRTNTYTELATGLKHVNGGRLVDSSDQITVTPTGAQATNAQHSVTFRGNINTAGAVDLTMPDGNHLTSSILGLAYFDTSSQQSVWISEVNHSVGQLLPSGNQALYPAVFTNNLIADVLYENKISGFEQLVVLRSQLPSPQDWNMDPASTLLEVFTEFSAPTPQITQGVVDSRLNDDLDFGTMQMPRGVAFALGAETNTIPVSKRWLTLNGHTCLVEQVPFQIVQAQVEGFLPPAPGSASISSPDRSLQLASGRTLPKARPVRKETQSFALADSFPNGGLFQDL